MHPTGQFRDYGKGDALRWEEAGGRGAAVRGRAVQVRSEAQKDTQLEMDAGKGAKTFTCCWSCLHQGLAKELLQTKEGKKKKKVPSILIPAGPVDFVL